MPSSSNNSLATGGRPGAGAKENDQMDINHVEIRKLSSRDLEHLTMNFSSEFNHTHHDNLVDQEQGRISFYVAWFRHRPIGHGLVKWGGARDTEIARVYPKCPEIYRMSVLQEFQSQGVGTRLLQACEQEARHRKLSLIGIGVGHDNPRAQALYTRLGYKRSKIDNCVFRYGRQLETGEVIWIEEPGIWLIKSL